LKVRGFSCSPRSRDGGDVLAGHGELFHGLGLIGHWRCPKNVFDEDSEGWRLPLGTDCEAQPAPVAALEAARPEIERVGHPPKRFEGSILPIRVVSEPWQAGSKSGQKSVAT
jgi:hypothetical protein